MSRKLMRSTLWVLVLACCWGCSTLLPERKEPLSQPKIQEEDVSEGPTKPETPVQQPTPIGPGPATAGQQGTTEPAPPVVTSPSGGPVETQDRHRRRFINRGGKWEPAQERPEASQPRSFY